MKGTDGCKGKLFRRESRRTRVPGLTPLPFSAHPGRKTPRPALPVTRFSVILRYGRARTQLLPFRLGRGSTEEMLAAIMKEAARDAAESKGKATEAFFEELRRMADEQDERLIAKPMQ